MGNLHDFHVSISEVPFATVVLVPWLFFAVSALFEDFPKIGLRQVAGLVAAVGWALGFLLNPDEDRHTYLIVSEVVGMLLFAGMWVREFRLLMLRRDDEFPGRFDKLAWIFALTILAPAGVWLHRSYRLAPLKSEVKSLNPVASTGPDEANRIDS
jgi:hypothetical protein